VLVVVIDPGRAVDPSFDPQDGPRKARKQLRVLPTLEIPEPPAPPPMPSAGALGGNASPQWAQPPASQAPAPSPSLPRLPVQEDAQQKIHQLELELEATRDEVEALHQMLEDLPEIFERKFRQRQKAFLDHHEHLLADNRALRERLYALGPATPAAPAALPPATTTTTSGSRRQRLRSALSSLFGR
jgi:hypothetical protein